MASGVDDIHALEPEDFIEEVYSFEHWFGAVESYLTNVHYGHRTDLEEPILEAGERERLLNILSNYVVAETTALDASSGLIRIAPNRHTKIFLSTQVADEGRHLEVMLNRMRELGVADPVAEAGKRASGSIRTFHEELLRLVEGRDWDSAIFAQNVVLEAMEFSVFSAHARQADPITRDLLERALRDERRHIGFGENEIGRRLRESPRRREPIARVKSRLDKLVLETFEATLAELDIPRDRRPALGREYLQAVGRLGVDG